MCIFTMVKNNGMEEIGLVTPTLGLAGHLQPQYNWPIVLGQYDIQYGDIPKMITYFEPQIIFDNNDLINSPRPSDAYMHQ